MINFVNGAVVQDQGPSTFKINFTVVSANAACPGTCYWDETIPGNEAFSGVAVTGRTDKLYVTPVI